MVDKPHTLHVVGVDESVDIEDMINLSNRYSIRYNLVMSGDKSTDCSLAFLQEMLEASLRQKYKIDEEDAYNENYLKIDLEIRDERMLQFLEDEYLGFEEHLTGINTVVFNLCNVPDIRTDRNRLSELNSLTREWKNAYRQYAMRRAIQAPVWWDRLDCHFIYSPGLTRDRIVPQALLIVNDTLSTWDLSFSMGFTSENYRTEFDRLRGHMNRSYVGVRVENGVKDSTGAFSLGMCEKLATTIWGPVTI